MNLVVDDLMSVSVANTYLCDSSAPVGKASCYLYRGFDVSYVTDERIMDLRT